MPTHDLFPPSVDAAFDEALDLFLAGETTSAQNGFRLVAERAPGYADAHYMEGMLTWKLGDKEKAVSKILRARDLNPEEWLYEYALGKYTSETDKSLANSHLKNAININPDHPDIWSLFFDINKNKDGYKRITDLSEEIVSKAATCVEALYTGAKANIAIGNFSAAERSLRKAISLNSHDGKLFHRLAIALEYQKKISEAGHYFDLAIKADPDNTTYHVDLGSNRLLSGQYRDGWRELEWRFTFPRYNTSAHVNAPRRISQLNGEASLLVTAEGGHGDVIQFSRFVGLAATTTRCVFEVQPNLVELFKSLHGDHVVIPSGATRPATEATCSVLSLPFLLHAPMSNTPYLSANPIRAERWRRKLAGLEGLRVGLAWAGNPQYGLDWTRSIRLEELSPIAGVTGVHFISLQKRAGPKSAPSSPPAFELHDWTEELTNFAETAALIEVLDLVISVDTSVAHLTGALGKPLWLLNRFISPHWVWGLEGDTTPWYGNVRQFRQEKTGFWDKPIDALAKALRRASERSTESI